MDGSEIEISDLRLLGQSDSPDLAEALIDFLGQDDPPVTRDPGAAIPVATYKRQIDRRALGYKTEADRRQLSRESLQRLLAQGEPPPRLQLAELLTDLYEKGTPSSRATLLEIIARAPLRFGLWGGLKRIYKRAEETLDAEIFGALACRIDIDLHRRGAASERDVGAGTLIYLRRRAWRFLRHLGSQVPALYPQFAVQTLRHYGGKDSFSSSWIVPRLWPSVFAYESQRKKPPDLLKGRPFDEVWKQAPDELMLLLETCENDAVAFFAIASLRRDFPDKLRHVTPAWLARLASRPLASAHDFLIDTLQGSPEFHQSKLRPLGLHDAVLALLLSPSARGRAYAIEYARAHAQDLPVERLEKLIVDGEREVVAFAAALISARPPRELGYAALGRLIDHSETIKFAEKALDSAFERGELPESFLIDMLYGSDEQLEWATGYLKSKYKPTELGTGFWKRVLDDKRHERRYSASDTIELAIESLGELPIQDVGASWLVEALLREDIGDAVGDWLAEAKALPAADVELLVERLKGLALHVKHRKVALRILENGKLVRPRDIGLPWLLALARRADEALHTFAHRYLLQHMEPQDFADGGDAEDGIAKLFTLATGDKEPEPVRLFAQTYLRCHHPGISGEQPEAKALHLKPQLKRTSYTEERVFPGLFDARADVRRFAVAIARAELRRWNALGRVYELAESDAKEVRNVAYDALLHAGDPSADLAQTLKVEELEPARVFALTESRKRSTREVGMELIRRHYARLGGAARLGWLMESPDREVRLFAVRLLWEKHRPRHLPAGWKPAAAGKKAAAPGSGSGPATAAAPADDHAGRFTDIESLRGFLRRLLFGLPPGRSMEPRDEGAPRRHLPASVAKRHVIEIVRDLGAEDEAFARLVAPVLGEFTGSLARGEWQACLSALLRLRAAHPALPLDGILTDGGGT